MTNRCAPEEKQHMIDLIVEFQKIMQSFPISKENRKATAERLQEIRTEMKAFRKRYPLD